MSAAVEMALKAVTSRPVEPVMLSEPMRPDQLPTPALILDRPTMDSNIQAMCDHLGRYAKGFRPHSKTHKCPEIAKQQMAAGAVGICTAKVSEAAVMASAGIDSILITSPISTRYKAQVVNAIITEQLTLLLVVDSIEGLSALQAEIDDDKRVGLLLDLDASTGRTGLRDNDLLLVHTV